MASASNAEWKLLPTTDRAQSLQNPVLFFKLVHLENGLRFQVTDLAHIWLAAKTSREDLKEEAARSRCSIDPSEDEEQYDVLAGKLEDAISGRGGASVRINIMDHGGDDVHGGFEIETSISLPPPFGMLEWRFTMVKQEAEILTKHLVLPAFVTVESSREREEDLRRKLKEKDHVIAKLMDKFETSGIDLSTVFPGFVGSRKALSVRQAARLVPGIKAFKEDEWERDGRGEDFGRMKEIVDTLRDSKTGGMVWRGSMTTLRAYNSNRQAEMKQNPGRGDRENEQELPPHPAVRDDGSDSSDFNNRATSRPNPPSSSPDPVRSGKARSTKRLRRFGTLGAVKSKSTSITRKQSFSTSPERDEKHLKSLLAGSLKQESVCYPTGHDDDSDSSDARTRTTSRPKPTSSLPDPVHTRDASQKQRSKKTWTGEKVGSKPSTITREKSLSTSSEPGENPPKELSFASIDSATEGETESESESAASGGATNSRNAISQKPTSKIGFIGGRKPQITNIENTKSPESPPLTSKTTPSRAKSKLGSIGGKNAKAASRPLPPSPCHQSETSSPTPSPPPASGIKDLETRLAPTPKPSVTPMKVEPPIMEAEKANQKRMELKRQLDEGAGRKKKKRKF